MNPIEAKTIIDNFHKSIKDLRPFAIVQSNKKLPYTSARIKYAHFVYGEDLIINAKITEATGQELIESYGLIDSLFSEDQESLNIRYVEYLEGLKNGIVTAFRMPNPFGEVDPVTEFYDFLSETWFLKFHTYLFNNDEPLGAFVYDGLRNKATKEKNIKQLIEITNTSLTRTVQYPGKKNTVESIIIK